MTPNLSARAAVLVDEIRATSRTEAVEALARALARAERAGFFSARDAMLAGVYAGAAEAEREAGWTGEGGK